MKTIAPLDLGMKGPRRDHAIRGRVVAGKTGARVHGQCSNPDHRAITPHGFARAFFKANP